MVQIIILPDKKNYRWSLNSKNGTEKYKNSQTIKQEQQ